MPNSHCPDHDMREPCYVCLLDEKAAQAEQIKRLEAVAEAAENFRDAVFLNATNVDEFRVRLEVALKEASK